MSSSYICLALQLGLWLKALVKEAEMDDDQSNGKLYHS